MRLADHIRTQIREEVHYVVAKINDSGHEVPRPWR
jgi:hypothetical protein